ncbi:hypothetical protein H8711_03505 [Clostridiaceae bacterium NSJ-31]|uniref:Uncharacterized protein n=1 Tax=Ligaoa zhengdingensis TaxID=2763658 RepID=A0A926DWF7_9FIRM|nr:hypothetical protein [Ligaoa zhengdingensis]MBC8546001.1 hypothetical protein [Ligaoa zhengdingensis]
MDNDLRIADLPPRVVGELDRLQRQIKRDTGKSVVLVAYEPEVQPTPVFDDRQTMGHSSLKENTFQGEQNLYGNITQWHL